MPKKIEPESRAGWFSVDKDVKIERFWDGTKWTNSIRIQKESPSIDTYKFKWSLRTSPKFEKMAFFVSTTIIVLLSFFTLFGFTSGQETKNSKSLNTSTAQESNPEEEVPVGFKQSESEDPKYCEVPDMRTFQLEPRNVGFPHSVDFLPVNGELNFVVVPIDFPDAIGEYDPEEYIKVQTSLMQKWMSYFSNDKVTYSFQTTSDWVRSPRLSADYAIEKGSPTKMTFDQDLQYQMAQDLINATENKFDFTSVNGIIFVFPNSILGLENDLYGNGITLDTPQGPKQLYIRGAGRHAYQDWGGRLTTEIKNSRMWEYWTHEILHAQGFAIHAPGNGFNAGIGQNPWSEIATLDAWELFKAGWLERNQIFCLSNSSQTPKQIALTPLEVDGEGYKSVIVRISDSEAIVVESHRPIGFSSEFSKYSSRMDFEGGLLVYRIDTKLDNDRTGENNGDNGNDPNWSKWAYLLAPTGITPSDAVGDPDGILSYMVSEGQNVSFAGTTVSMIKSGNKDYISISK